VHCFKTEIAIAFANHFQNSTMSVIVVVERRCHECVQGFDTTTAIAIRESYLIT
jgi:hypothetical protein